MPTVLVTGGGHSGIGLVGAKTLAVRYGCDLILAGRNVERTEKGARELRAETWKQVRVIALDLNSLQSVREGTEQIKAMLQADGGRLHGILCNAGAQSNGPCNTARMAMKQHSRVTVWALPAGEPAARFARVKRPHRLGRKRYA